MLDLAVGTLSIDATSSIDVTGKGRGPGNYCGGCGGSYGGYGAGQSPNDTYGDYRDPDDWGTGSGWLYNVGGHGGGQIRIVADSLVL